MTFKTDNKIFGNLNTTKYIFEKSKDILPMHSHSKDGEHITIVLKGSINLFDNNRNLIKKMNQGEIYDFKETEQTHEIEALEDCTEILNISKYFVNDELTEKEIQEQEEATRKYHEEFRQQQLLHIKQVEEETKTI